VKVTHEGEEEGGDGGEGGSAPLLGGSE
jgi:hypothetical protein